MLMKFPKEAFKGGGLYVHVPFCLKKCDYCDFYSKKSEKEAIRAYLSALECEIEALPADFCPETVYVGGGTPSALDAADFSSLFALLGRVPVANGCEFSCEVNPGTFCDEKVKILRENGVNRVSLGVQSMSDRVLSFLGRIHGKKHVFEAVEGLKRAKIDNFNVDLMYGLPREAGQEVKTDLEALVELNPTHISCYCLSYEEGTPLEERWSTGDLKAASDERCLEEYTLIRHMLVEYGFEHYEISNFCRPERACRHNLAYWLGGDYMGIGPAAHAYWRGCRYANAADLVQWDEDVRSKGALNHCEPELSVEKRAREQLVLGLRMLDGVDLAVVSERTGVDLSMVCGGEIESLVQEGMLEMEGNWLRLSDRALFVSNRVLSELI